MRIHQQPEHSNNSLSVFAPLKIAVAYIFTTIALHLFGPWTYQDEAALLMLGFMVLATFAAGYWSVANRWRDSLVKDDEVCARNYKRFLRLAMWGLIFQSALVVLAFGSDLTDGEISFFALLDPGQIYIDALAAGKETEGNVSLLSQIRTLFSPLVVE